MSNASPMTDKLRACPICGRARDPDHTPFCSQRCRDRDLARWFSDSYAVPGRALSPDEIPDAPAD